MSTLPAIDPTFPGATASWLYWSATTSADNPAMAWLGNFRFDAQYPNPKTLPKPVRAVRGGR